VSDIIIIPQGVFIR